MLFVRHALPGERVIVEVTEDKGGAFCRADAVEILTASPGPGRAALPAGQAGRVRRLRLAARDAGRATGAQGVRGGRAVAAAGRARRRGRGRGAAGRPAGLAHPATARGRRAGPRRPARAPQPPGAAAGRQRGCPISVPDLFGDVLDTACTTPRTELDVVLDDTGNRHVASLEPIPQDRPRQYRTAGCPAARRRSTRRAATGGCTRTASGRCTRPPRRRSRTWSPSSRPPPVGGSAWDLYGGVGLFAAVLAEQVGPDGSVLLVESVASASTTPGATWPTCRRCAFSPVASNTSWWTAPISPSAGWTSSRTWSCSTRRARARGARWWRQSPVSGRCRVVYVACDPAALARDLACFAEHGYRLGRAARVRRVPDDPPRGVRRADYPVGARQVSDPIHVGWSSGCSYRVRRLGRPVDARVSIGVLDRARQPVVPLVPRLIAKSNSAR